MVVLRNKFIAGTSYYSNHVSLFIRDRKRGRAFMQGFLGKMEKVGHCSGGSSCRGRARVLGH